MGIIVYYLDSGQSDKHRPIQASLAWDWDEQMITVTVTESQDLADSFTQSDNAIWHPAYVCCVHHPSPPISFASLHSLRRLVLVPSLVPSLEITLIQDLPLLLQKSQYPKQ